MQAQFKAPSTTNNNMEKPLPAPPRIHREPDWRAIAPLLPPQDSSHSPRATHQPLLVPARLSATLLAFHVAKCDGLRRRRGKCIKANSGDTGGFSRQRRLLKALAADASCPCMVFCLCRLIQYNAITSKFHSDVISVRQENN